MLRDAVLKWCTALDLGYVDAKSWRIVPHMIRRKQNRLLQGGFGAEFSLEDLRDLEEFWNSQQPNDLLTLFDDSKMLTRDEWRYYMSKVQRSTRASRIHRRKPIERPVWLADSAIDAILRHPTAPPAALPTYLALCRLERGAKGEEIDTTVPEIGSQVGISARSVATALSALEELRLCAVDRHRRGVRVTLLNHFG